MTNGATVERMPERPDRRPAALVTGGSSGIGFEMAGALAGQGYGVTLVARRPETVERAVETLREENLEVIGVSADLTEEAGVIEAIARHRETWGRLDVLVNNAGGGIMGPLQESSLKHIDRQLDLNLRSVVLFYRHATELLLEAGADGGALVVNTASIHGKHAEGGLAVYSAAKHGVVGLSEAMNLELGERGVKSCVFCPGYVDTPLAAPVGVPSEEMIRPSDLVEVLKALLQLSRHCVIPEVVFLRPGLRV
jgi:NAD(P)-dependent dehydrogenase (short-subunit alcohol dehydrogenase family)